MTQKELLLIDLSARLPHEVKVTWDGKHPLTVTPYIYCAIASEDNINNLPKLLLRPMSSMTEEEENEWHGLNIDPLFEAVGEQHTRIEDLMLRAKSQYNPVDWLNAHHFDYRGLIPKGLAIEVTEENNPYK